MEDRPDPSREDLARLRADLAQIDPALRGRTLARIEGMRMVPDEEREELEDMVVAALDDGEPSVRAAAIRAVVSLRGGRAGRELVEAASSDPSPAVRREAVAALGRVLSRERRAAATGGPRG